MKNFQVETTLVDLKSIVISMHQGINTVTEKVQYVDYGVPIIQSKHITDGFLDLTDARQMTSDDYIKYREKYQPTEGDLLLCNIGTIGKSILVEKNKKFLIAWNLFKIKPDARMVLPAFLKYFFDFLLSKSFYARHLTGGTVKFVSKKVLGEIKIPLPSLAEQQRIVAILDKADALRRKTVQLLAYYDQLGQAIFYEMFGDPIKNEKGWELKKLEDVCLKITDGTHHSPTTLNQGDYKYITAKHVKPFKVDFEKDPTYVSEVDHLDIYTRCNPKKGDVLYIKDGATTGIAAINNLDEPFSMLSSLALIKTDKSLLEPNFLVHLLNNERFKAGLINKYMSGAAIKRYTLKKIKNFDIILPPVSQQEEFCEKMKLLWSQKNSTFNSHLIEDQLFDSLLTKHLN